MLSVKEASKIILSNLIKPRITALPVGESVSYVLAEEVHADRDFPPFHRVSMDGIALQFAQWNKGQREFLIEDVQAAGMPQKKLKNAQNCFEVMTGAVLPQGTDTVIRYEDLEIKEGRAIVLAEDVQHRQSLHPQGQDARKDDLLLEPGIILSPAEIALLASVGKSEVKVFAFPKTAIVASGDELVAITSTPDAHQIRRSNTYAVEAAMRMMGWKGAQFHLSDEKNDLTVGLKKIVEDHDVIILSGGVSKGKFDFIPEVLENLGVRKLFHQVSQRPGKPFWFGVSNEDKVVFALPGNPVSTYMCFYRYIKPWMLKSLGVEDRETTAILATDFSFPPKLTYFLQVKILVEDGRLIANPDAGGGSGDFANLKNVDGFLELSDDRSEFKAGEVFPYIPFRLL